jgi:hypothetical protein
MGDQPHLPFRGRSAVSRANSLQAGQDAALTRAPKTLAALRFYHEAGPHGLTDYDLEGLSGFMRSTICSIRNALIDAGLVVEHGSRPSGPWHRSCTVYLHVDHRPLATGSTEAVA